MNETIHPQSITLLLFVPGKSIELEDPVLNLHKPSGYLKVFDVREGNPNGDHGPGIVIGEVQPFAHFSSAHSDQQSTVCNEESHDAREIYLQLSPGPVVSVPSEPHLFLRCL